MLVSQGCSNKAPQTGGLNNRNLLSYNSGGFQKSKIKVSVGLVPSEESEGKSVPSSPSASGGLLTISGVPLVVCLAFFEDKVIPNLCLYLPGMFSMCTSMSKFSLFTFTLLILDKGSS